MPPLPAAVIEWVRAKLVTPMSLRVPVRVPRSHESRTSHESSTTLSPWRSAMARIASQSGQLPTRLGVRIALVAVGDPLLDAGDVDHVGVGLDVDEHGHDPRLHHRRDVGART